jgi:hypothetical protein
VLACHGFASEHTHEKVHDERKLSDYQDKQTDRCDYVQRLKGLIVGIDRRLVNSALPATQADEKERNECQVETDPGENEVQLTSHSAPVLKCGCSKACDPLLNDSSKSG